MSYHWKSILLEGSRMIFVLITGFIVYRFFRLSIWGTISISIAFALFMDFLVYLYLRRRENRLKNNKVRYG